MNENINVLQPYLVEKIARPKLGKWIGAVDFSEDWLVRRKKIAQNYLRRTKIIFTHVHVCSVLCFFCHKLCGGGPSLSLWHLRTMEPATVFNLPDQGIHDAKIFEDRVITGGTIPHVYHLNYQGEVVAEVPTSSNTVYSIVYQETPQNLLSIAGSSNNIDICTNFNYRELILKFA